MEQNDHDLLIKIDTRLQAIEAKVDKLDDKYAIKLVEKIVFWLITGIGVAVLGAMLKLIIK